MKICQIHNHLFLSLFAECQPSPIFIRAANNKPITTRLNIVDRKFCLRLRSIGMLDAQRDGQRAGHAKREKRERSYDTPLLRSTHSVLVLALTCALILSSLPFQNCKPKLNSRRVKPSDRRPLPFHIPSPSQSRVNERRPQISPSHPLVYIKLNNTIIGNF
jgi:hypothetical protein